MYHEKKKRRANHEYHRQGRCFPGGQLAGELGVFAGIATFSERARSLLLLAARHLPILTSPALPAVSQLLLLCPRSPLRIAPAPAAVMELC